MGIDPTVKKSTNKTCTPLVKEEPVSPSVSGKERELSPTKEVRDERPTPDTLLTVRKFGIKDCSVCLTRIDQIRVTVSDTDKKSHAEKYDSDDTIIVL